MKKVFVFDDEWSRYKEKVFEPIRPQIEKALGEEVMFEGPDYDNLQPLAPQIRAGIDQALGLKNGNIDCSAVLLDIRFFHSQGIYSCFDRIPDRLATHPLGGQSLFDELVASGVPTIVLSDSDSYSHMLSAGREQMAWLPKKELIRHDKLDLFAQELAKALRSASENLRFDRKTLEVENRFALIYDEEELKQIATLAVILWENSRVITAAKQALDRSQRLRILDIGCGTGRFEEVLLAHSDVGPYVEHIVAVDFAPNYLIEAEKRLKALDVPNRTKVCFCRRIAEDLRFDDDSFDLVLVGFGVPCFSRYQKSIPEAARVLRPQGTMVLTAYNRDSLNFEFEEEFSEKATGGRRSFFCAEIDRDRNQMMLPNVDPFPCHTFTIPYFKELILQHAHIPEDGTRSVEYRPIETFPFLHGCSSRELIDRCALGERGSRPHLGPDGPKSYRKEILERHPMFSPSLYQMDLELCRLSPLRDRGHYINVIATKRPKH